MTFSKGYALIIGIGTYKYAPQLDVPITTYDAKEVAEVLRDENYCGYPPDQVTLLHDTDATCDRIMEELDRLSKQLKAEHTLFFFYSGHGMYGYGEDDSYYLTTHDSKFQGEELFQRVIDNSGVSGKKLLEVIDKIKAKQIFLFFNACHSGALASGSLDGSQTQEFKSSKALPDELSTQLGSGEGRATIAACKEDQTSSFPTEAKLTFFGNALVEGLKGKEMPDDNGYISIGNLYSYIHRQVKKSASKYSKLQEPKMVQMTVGNLLVALHNGSITYKFRQAINIFCKKIEEQKNVIYIRQIDLYKDVCSWLYRLEFECHSLMRRDVRRVSQQANYFVDIIQDIDFYKDSLKEIYIKLCDLENKNKSNVDFIIKQWCDNISDAIKELDLSFNNKDIGSFIRASWLIEAVTKDGFQKINNLSVNSIQKIIENLQLNELESMLNHRFEYEIDHKIFYCITNLMEMNKEIIYHIDKFEILTQIHESLRYNRELEDPHLSKHFVNRIKEKIELLEKHINSDANKLIDNWIRLEKEMSSESLNILATETKRCFSKVNQDLKVCVDNLLNNLVEK
jgi:hypothetical protein